MKLRLLRAAVGRGPAHHGADQVVAVAEHVGRDLDAVADAALGRVAAVVHRRGGELDDDPGWRLRGWIMGWFRGRSEVRLADAHDPDVIPDAA